MIRLSIIGLIFLISGQVIAQEFRAYSNASQVVEGTTFTVSFELSGAGGTDFRPPDFRSFQVLNGPNTSSSTTIINGQMSRKQTLSYTLLAQNQGSFTIGAASMRVGKRRVQTKPISIKVVERSETEGGEEFFVRAEWDTDTAYVGQQIRLKLKLYTKVRVERYDLLAQPEFEDIYVEDVPRYDRKSKLEVYEGQQYSTQVLREMALYPQKSGSYDLGSFVMRLGVADESGGGRRSNSFFFTSRLRTHDLNTNKVSFEVIPVPQPEPVSYSGGIGQYQVKMKSDRTRLSTDDALSLVVTIQGDGDVRMLQAPNLNLTDDFEVYDANEISSQSLKDQDNSFEKSFEYLIVPKAVGEIYLAPEFTYFNPDSARYETVIIDSLMLEVSKGTSEGQALKQFKEDQQLDIAPIQMTWSTPEKNGYWQRKPWFKGLLFLLGLAFVGLLWQKRKVDADQALDPKVKKYRKARKEIEKRLSLAKAQIGQSGFYEELSLGLKQYFCDKLDMEMAHFTKSALEQRLHQTHVPKALVETCVNVLKNCEWALFAPSGTIDPEETYEKAVQAALEVDEYL